MASFTKEVKLRLAKCPMGFNGRLANRGLTSLLKEATVVAKYKRCKPLSPYCVIDGNIEYLGGVWCGGWQHIPLLFSDMFNPMLIQYHKYMLDVLGHYTWSRCVIIEWPYANFRTVGMIKPLTYIEPLWNMHTNVEYGRNVPVVLKKMKISTKGWYQVTDLY